MELKKKSFEIPPNVGAPPSSYQCTVGSFFSYLVSLILYNEFLCEKQYYNSPTSQNALQWPKSLFLILRMYNKFLRY